jgi:IS4 transposase
VICFWDDNFKIWHTYVTNLPSEEYSNEEVYHLYQYRWIIELLFKEMKGDYDLGHLLFAKDPLAYVHIYSMLIRLVIT